MNDWARVKGIAFLPFFRFRSSRRARRGSGVDARGPERSVEDVGAIQLPIHACHERHGISLGEVQRLQDLRVVQPQAVPHHYPRLIGDPAEA